MRVMMLGGRYAGCWGTASGLTYRINVHGEIYRALVTPGIELRFFYVWEKSL